MSKPYYNPKLVDTKTLSIRRDEKSGKLEIVSNYTGAVEPFTLNGLITQIKDLIIY